MIITVKVPVSADTIARYCWAITPSTTMSDREVVNAWKYSRAAAYMMRNHMRLPKNGHILHFIAGDADKWEKELQRRGLGVTLFIDRRH